MICLTVFVIQFAVSQRGFMLQVRLPAPKKLRIDMTWHNLGGLMYPLQPLGV